MLKQTQIALAVAKIAPHHFTVRLDEHGIYTDTDMSMADVKDGLETQPEFLKRAKRAKGPWKHVTEIEGQGRTRIYFTTRKLVRRQSEG